MSVIYIAGSTRSHGKLVPLWTESNKLFVIWIIRTFLFTSELLQVTAENSILSYRTKATVDWSETKIQLVREEIRRLLPSFECFCVKKDARQRYMDTKKYINNCSISQLLCFRTLSNLRYSRNQKTQRSGNWICFRPQVSVGGDTYSVGSLRET
jgi:hypothetical protein